MQQPRRIQILVPLYSKPLYRPQTKFWGKVIFSQASVILSTGESASSGSASRGRGSASKKGLHPGGGSASRGLHPARGWIDPPIRYYRLRLTSGWYASYWIAFLFKLCSDRTKANGKAKNFSNVWYLFVDLFRLFFDLSLPLLLCVDRFLHVTAMSPVLWPASSVF